jgi:hypothetical protein
LVFPLIGSTDPSHAGQKVFIAETNVWSIARGPFGLCLYGDQCDVRRVEVTIINETGRAHHSLPVLCRFTTAQLALSNERIVVNFIAGSPREKLTIAALPAEADGASCRIEDNRPLR